ncbi:hypothetical protein BB560_005437, partial [Smittium megazygosporum]
RLAEYLKLQLIKHKNPILLSPIRGPKIEVTHFTNINLIFEDDISNSMQFSIMKNCSVNVSLGLEICQKIEAKIDYATETFTFSIGTEEYSIRIFSKEQIIEEGNLEEEEVDSDYEPEKKEITKSTQESSTSGLKLKHKENEVFLQNNHNPPSEEQAIAKFVQKHNEIFPKLGDLLPGIHECEFEIKLKMGTSPTRSYPRRYSPIEKNAIKEEVDLMTKNKII